MMGKQRSKIRAVTRDAKANRTYGETMSRTTASANDAKQISIRQEAEELPEGLKRGGGFEMEDSPELKRDKKRGKQADGGSRGY